MRHGTLWWNGFAGHLLQCRMECTQPMIQRENLWKKIHPFSLKKELLWPMASKELPGWFKEIMNGSAMPSSCRIELVWTHAGNAQQRKTCTSKNVAQDPWKGETRLERNHPWRSLEKGTQWPQALLRGDSWLEHQNGARGLPSHHFHQRRFGTLTWIYPPSFYVVWWGRGDPGSPPETRLGNNLSSYAARVCDPGHSNQNHQLENDHDHKPQRAPQDLGQFRPQSIRNQMVPDGFCTNSKRIGDSLTKAWSSNAACSRRHFWAY